MTKYWLPLTYKPKIEPVLSGKCTQTIRPGDKYKVGDQTAFHGWEGKPYRSRWSFRTEMFDLNEVIDIIVFPDSIFDYITKMILTDEECDELARLDNIVPPTKKELLKVLGSMHDLEYGVDMQIIRWIFYQGVSE